MSRRQPRSQGPGVGFRTRATNTSLRSPPHRPANVAERSRKFFEEALGGTETSLALARLPALVPHLASRKNLPWKCRIHQAVMGAYPEVSWGLFHFPRWRLYPEWRRLLACGCSLVRTSTEQYVEHLMAEYKVPDLATLRTTTLSNNDEDKLATLGGKELVISILSSTQNEPLVPLTAGVGDWAAPEVRRRFFETLLASTSPYSINSRMYYRLGAGGMLVSLYNHSAATGLCVEFPELPWRVWDFTPVPRRFWKSLFSNLLSGDPVAEVVCREYLEHTRIGLGFASVEAWRAALKAKDPASLLAYDPFNLDGGVEAVMRIIFDNDRRQSAISYETATTGASPGKFFDPRTRFSFLEAMRRKLGNSVEGLYRISQPLLRASGGRALHNLYQDTPSIVATEHPDHAWERWKFGGLLSRHWWDQLADLIRRSDVVAQAVVEDFVRYLAAQMNVQDAAGWSRVSVRALGQWIPVIDRLGRLPNLIAQVYPEEEFDIETFSLRSKKSTQQFVRGRMQILFPTEDIEEELNVQKLGFAQPDGMQAGQVSFDLVIRRLRLVIEYHGHQHYQDSVYGNSTPRKRLDRLKKDLCEYNNFTYFEVPYWWDYDLDKLANSLHLLRPDIIPELRGTKETIPRLRKRT